MAVTDKPVEDGRAHGLFRRSRAPEEQVGSRGTHAHGEVEEIRFGQKDTEDHLLHRIQPEIGVHQLSGLHEDIHDAHAGGAVGLAGTTEQAAAEFVGNGLGIADDLVGKIADERQLAAGHVSLHVRRPEHGADGLAVAALHAEYQLVVQGHQTTGQLFQFTHLRHS